MYIVRDISNIEIENETENRPTASIRKENLPSTQRNATTDRDGTIRKNIVK
jgi:hypothetical protein